MQPRMNKVKPDRNGLGSWRHVGLEIKYDNFQRYDEITCVHLSDRLDVNLLESGVGRVEAHPSKGCPASL